MQQLDLKFVVHHGEFIRQRMAGREELAGRDVILVHRLLKNTVKERLGDHAYALFSDACIRATDIDPASQGLVAHEETIDVIGQLTCWVRDLEGAWNEEKDRRRHLVTRKQAAHVIEFDIARPAPAGVGVFHLARTAAEMARGRRGARSRRRAAAAASAPPITACTVRTPSSRRFSTGVRSTT